jgi:hypothetical protein
MNFPTSSFQGVGRVHPTVLSLLFAGVLKSLKNPGQSVIAVVNDTGNNYSQVTTTPANSLLQVMLTQNCKYLPEKTLK